MRREAIKKRGAITGKLAEHCPAIDKAAFEQTKRIGAGYLKAPLMPEEDTLERISTQAQMIADKKVAAELNYL